MMTDGTDNSESGFLTGPFEGVSQTFTDVEVMTTSEVNVVAKAKRYGRWWLLKGLRAEVAASAVHQHRLRKELEILMQLQHPNVVTAYGLEEVEGIGLCIVMDYVDGVTMKEWLQGETTKESRRRIARELTKAIGYVHSKGIVHRDLKPGNVIVTRQGERVVLIDFGLADTESYTILKQPAGTPRYMSPEQMQTETADVRNDIYSLGVMFRQMALGRSYNSIIKRCLLPIEERFQSVKVLEQAVDRRQSLGRWLTAGVIVLLLLMTIVVLVLFGLKQRTQNQQMRTQQQLIAAQQAKIEQQKLELDSMQYYLSESQQIQVSQDIAIASLTNQVDTVTDYQQHQRMKETELLSKKQSRERMSKAYMAGVDSLRKAVEPQGASTDERYVRGQQAVERFIENQAIGLSDEEKKEVRISLLRVLEAYRAKWIKQSDHSVN